MGPRATAQYAHALRRHWEALYVESQDFDHIHCYFIFSRKDVNGFFAYPVNDMIAPGYSLIIANPMDFSTIMTKIDCNEYDNVLEFKV
jgi:hypothetical protein